MPARLRKQVARFIGQGCFDMRSMATDAKLDTLAQSCLRYAAELESTRIQLIECANHRRSKHSILRQANCRFVAKAQK